MNKQDLANHLADTLDLTKKTAEAAITELFGAIAKELKRGNKVTIFGVGSFSVRKRAARLGRNPQTGATVKIKASKAPAFKPAKAFKDAI